MNYSEYHLPEGTILKERYRTDCVLGRGGFGITYKGTDLMLEMTVAVKEFFPYGYAVRSFDSSEVLLSAGHEFFDKWRERFLAEARILAKCTDVPAIVQVRDFFEENNTAYIVMEYLSGISLQDFLLRNGVIPAGKMFSYMIPLLRDLDQIHRLGLIHRDISPDNIMLMPGDTLKLFDFGAARDYTGEESRTLSVMLKPGFAPEEQYRKKGEQGPWTDVYAICATIYKCITGVTPPESLERLYKDDLVRPSRLGCPVSAEMEEILLKGMSIRGEDRFPDAASLADAMEACRKDPALFSSSETVTEMMDAEGPRAAKQPPANPLKKSRKFRMLLLIAAAVIILVGGIILISSKNPRNKTEIKNPELSGTDQETGAFEAEKTPGMLGGVYEPVSDNALLDSALWGIHSFQGENFPSAAGGFRDIAIKEGSLNVSSLPLAFVINPAWTPEPLICLCFTDQFQYLYFVFGAYQVEGDVLRIFAPADPQAVPAFDSSEILDKLPVLQDDLYIYEEGISCPDDKTAYLLAEEITFAFRLNHDLGKTGRVSLKNEKNQIVYQSGFVNDAGGNTPILHLQGRASDPERLYNGVESLDLLYNPERGETSAVISYADGGRSLNAEVIYYSDSTDVITIKATKISRTYNGRTETFDQKENLNLTYINTYPYGFIITLNQKGETNYYYYQLPPE